MENHDELRNSFARDLGNVRTLKDLEAVQIQYLGRKGLLAESRKTVDFRVMSEDQRAAFGRNFNEAKEYMETAVEAAKARFGGSAGAAAPKIDITLPGSGVSLGALHPISLVQMELEEIFMSMGFRVDYGFDIETEHYNFDSLNIPFDHPAREMQDTFWLSNGMLLRTQTSANQVRALERYGAPFKGIFPGRCFRYEAIDATHENTFYQLEGLMVDKDISVAHLISVMKLLLSQVFHREVTVRLRPGYFPFVEPGFELDIKCLICGGKGCRSCKNAGWLELLPCGLVHPNVLRHGGIDPDVWSGFAFGLGLTRLAMMKYAIPDIRLFNLGDIRMLEQFPASVF